jgi:hypothetical protein
MNRVWGGDEAHSNMLFSKIFLLHLDFSDEPQLQIPAEDPTLQASYSLSA